LGSISEKFILSDLKYYSEEQQADEFAVEVMMQMGVSHKHFADFLFSLQKPVED